MNRRGSRLGKGLAGQQQQQRNYPQRIADVVSGLLASRGYANVQTAADRERAWFAVAGERFAGHTRPGHVRRGVLYISVENSVVMQELSFQKSDLLQRLVELVPNQQICDIRFRIGPIE